MMFDENPNPILSFAKLLWSDYREELIVFPVTIITVVTSTLGNRTFGWLDGLAILLLVGYLIYIFFDTYRSNVATAINVNSGYSICLGKPIDFFDDSVRKQISTLKDRQINLTRIERHFRVIDIDWQYYDQGVVQPLSWANSINEISRHFFRYTRRLPINTKLHLFLIVPATAAMGIGYVIGKHRRWNLYEYSRSVYTPVQLSNNTTKSGGRAEFQYISVEGDVKSDEVAFVLSFVSLPNIAIPENPQDIVEIRPKTKQKFIPVEEFPYISQEISDVIHEYIQRGKKIKMYPGLPVALSFMVGSQIDEHATISVHNLNRETGWERVFDLHTLEAR